MAHKLAREIDGFIYGETENGGTNTIYVSPVPFAELDKVIQKGPGRPGFQTVKDSMAPEDKLLRALIAAPIAGVAAGLLHTVRAAKKRTTVLRRISIMKTNLPPRWQTRIYHLTVFALLFTGFAQMPIFKRYYLADLPGFAWTADYYLNHRIHYVLAALLLFFMTYVTVAYLGTWRKKYTLSLSEESKFSFGWGSS